MGGNIVTVHGELELQNREQLALEPNHVPFVEHGGRLGPGLVTIVGVVDVLEWQLG